jgi:hypothetical protein
MRREMARVPLALEHYPEQILCRCERPGHAARVTQIGALALAFEILKISKVWG